MSEQTKVPYYLLIHTDSYTGNFDRELVAYAIGVLDKEQNNYAREYKKAFWNHVGASDIDSVQIVRHMKNLTFQSLMKSLKDLRKIIMMVKNLLRL